MPMRLQKLTVAFALLCAAPFIGSCASNYGEASLTGGFREERLGPADYWINFSGNGYTSAETTQTFWLHRAAALTIENRYDGFMIMSPVKLASNTPPAIHVRYGDLRPFDSISLIVDSGIDGKPFIAARIRFLKAPFEENGATIFDAHRLKAFLDPYVIGKLCGTNVCPHVHKYLFPNYGVEPVTLPPQPATNEKRRET
jgi:hypothetical protein